MPNVTRVIDKNECADESAVSWAAVIAGTFAAIAVSLVLLMLGSALGLSSVSPWSYANPGVAEFTVKAAIWLVVMQWAASGLGGYLAGRLRTKWTDLHTDEVFFRDTAHGFLAWAVATVLAAGFLSSAATVAISGGVRGATTVAAGAAAGGAGAPRDGMNPADPTAYYIDALFRPSVVGAARVSPPPGPGPLPLPPRDDHMEALRILAYGVKNGDVPNADRNYLATLVSVRTGISQTDAAARVNETIAQLNALKEKARENADAARKTGVKVAIYVFLSLLIGAFIASISAVLGGKRRDEY